MYATNGGPSPVHTGAAQFATWISVIVMILLTQGLFRFMAPAVHHWIYRDYGPDVASWMMLGFHGALFPAVFFLCRLLLTQLFVGVAAWVALRIVNRGDQ
jgi:hypothetical protein